jgi:hypothetical protein
MHRCYKQISATTPPKTFLTHPLLRHCHCCQRHSCCRQQHTQRIATALSCTPSTSSWCPAMPLPMLPLSTTNGKDDGSLPLSSLANRAKIAAWRAKQGMLKAEVMERYVGKCNRQLCTYSTRNAAGGSGGSGSASRTSVSLPMPLTATTESAAHLHGPLAVAAASTMAKMVTAASTRGGERLLVAMATTAGIPAMHCTQRRRMLWPAAWEPTGHHGLTRGRPCRRGVGVNNRYGARVGGSKTLKK